jgi:hypothetical protein
VELDEIDPTWHVNCAVKTKQKDREKNILEQLRLGHLNSEERKLLVGTCVDYQDISTYQVIH